MKTWWKEAVGYQIYIKSFFDGNNDGIGDLEGIYQKLDYLHLLGVNLLWICPFYDSPMDDNGYDVRDFFKVDKQYGSMDDFKKIVLKCKELKIRIILDFVLNHTSDEHPWFIESSSSIDNPKRDYYIWSKGRIIDGILKPPTNWGSFFGGSAWNYSAQTDSYYMKIFSNKMPDLNWRCESVRQEMMGIAKWWLDFGIDGFRIDAVSHLDRAEFVDSHYQGEVVLDWHKFSNLPKVHDYLKELNKEVFSPYNALTVGEVGGEASIDSGLKYSSYSSKELSMVFNFDHNWCSNSFDITNPDDLVIDTKRLKDVFNKWHEAFEHEGWLPLNWLNHDQPRLMSHYGNTNYFNESGKMLATAMYLRRGTPFIYQGEEIGMTNFPFTDESQIYDISAKNTYINELKYHPKEVAFTRATKHSRDNPRTMMQWDSSDYAGFSKVKPWYLVNPNYPNINVASQVSNEDSLWSYYQKLISLRRFSEYSELICYGKYIAIDNPETNIYMYKRTNDNQELIVITNFSKEEVQIDKPFKQYKKVIISNYKNHNLDQEKLNIRAYEAIVILL